MLIGAKLLCFSCTRAGKTYGIFPPRAWLVCLQTKSLNLCEIELAFRLIATAPKRASYTPSAEVTMEVPQHSQKLLQESKGKRADWHLFFFPCQSARFLNWEICEKTGGSERREGAFVWWQIDYCI